MVKAVGFYHAGTALQAAAGRPVPRRAWRSAATALHLLLALICGAAKADDARVGRLLQAFDELALWHDGKTLVTTRKWTGPLRLRIDGNPGSGHEAMAVETLESYARLAGLTIERVAPGASEPNMIVRFEQTSSYFINGRAAGCYATTRWNVRGELQRAELFINFSMGSQLRQCIVHEAMHAFGFPGHPHGLDSVLSYVYRRDALTELDEAAFRTLYDRRVRTNLYYLPALQIARQVIAEQIKAVAPGASAAGLGEAYLQRAAGYLRDAAEGGHVYAQRQMGVAHYFGQVVARDDDAAVAWWRRAAAQNDTESIYLLGEASLAGRGTARDPAAALVEHRRAAERGHAGAMLRVAQALEAGDGVAPDATAAAMWYALAVQRGVNDATAPRDQIMGRLGAAGRAEVESRVRSWRPAQ